MTPRERILTALDGGTPDRVPCALGFYQVDLEQLAPAGAYRDDLIDAQFVRFPLSPEDEELERQVADWPFDTRVGSPEQIGTYQRWRYHPETPEQRNPLARAESLEELQAFPLPEATAPYRAERLSEGVEYWHERGLAVGGNLPHLGGELFETAWRLRGLTPFLLDLVRRPEWADYLLDRLTSLARRNAETVAAAGVDILTLDDDVGMPGTMFIGPALWRRFLKPRMAEIIGAARAINPDIRVLYHSDGHIMPIVTELPEIGINALNPLQPEHMDAEQVRRACGNRLALWGAVGHQRLFSHGTPDEIRREVKHRIDTLGRAGLILCPAYDIDEPDIPWENIAAFLEAVQRNR